MTESFEEIGLGFELDFSVDSRLFGKELTFDEVCALPVGTRMLLYEFAEEDDQDDDIEDVVVVEKQSDAEEYGEIVIKLNDGTDAPSRVRMKDMQVKDSECYTRIWLLAEPMPIEKLAVGASIYSKLKANLIDNVADLQQAFETGEIKRILKSDAIKTVRTVCKNAHIDLPDPQEAAPSQPPAPAAPKSAPSEIITDAPAAPDDEHAKALALHRRILADAQIVSDSLYDMCSAIKEMRDGKHYKALLYDNFEGYCECELGMSRAQAYRYITIAEGMSAENVSSLRQIGTTKLALLASVTEEQRQEVAANVDVESASVRELKAQIDALKHEADNLERLRADAEERAAKWYEKASSADADAGQLRDRVKELESRNKNLQEYTQKAVNDLDAAQRQIKRMEAAPVEVAVQEDTEAMERLREEYERKLDDLRDELECGRDVNGEFKALRAVAKEVLHRITVYLIQNSDRPSMITLADQLLADAQKEFDAVKAVKQ